MLLKAWNRALVEDREKTYLTAAVAVADTTLTVASVNADVGSNSTWADNIYIIVGEIGSPNAEVLQMAAAASDGTSLTIDQLGAGGARFAHSVGEPVYRVDYNRVEFSRNTTNTVTGVTVLVTQLIQPDEEYTRYEDTTNTTGYGFVRWENQTSGAFSAYSDGVNYESSGEGSSYDPRTLWRLRKRVRVLLDEDKPTSKLTDDMIRDAINDKQRDIGHSRLWSFLEGERTFSIVANQFAYDIPTTVQKVYQVTFDTQPLIYVNYETWKQLHWDTNTSSDSPSHYTIWNRQLLIYPRPSTASSTTAINAGGGISATATSVTVDATSAFNRGDYFRFIIDSEVIYATASTATTFTGLLRGREGTTAATHADDATITERDIVYSTHVEPTDLFDTQDRTVVPEVDVLAYGAAIDLVPIAGKADLLKAFKTIYDQKFKELESKYSVKQTSQFGVVKSASEKFSSSRRVRNPNLYPLSIDGLD